MLIPNPLQNNTICTKKCPDSHNYVNSYVNANNSGNSQCSHAPSSSSGSRRSGEQQHNYVNQPPIVAQHHHHHHHHSKEGSGHGKHRRNGQKRVTHNEKRYHSGTIEDEDPFCDYEHSLGRKIFLLFMHEFLFLDLHDEF